MEGICDMNIPEYSWKNITQRRKGGPVAMGTDFDESEVCLTLCNPRDYTVHGILQARILEWVAFPFSKGDGQISSPPFSLPFPSLPLSLLFSFSLPSSFPSFLSPFQKPFSKEIVLTSPICKRRKWSYSCPMWGLKPHWFGHPSILNMISEAFPRNFIPQPQETNLHHHWN